MPTPLEHIAVGAPLLTSDEDFQSVAGAITQATAQYDDGDTAICFMGHGPEVESNQVYGQMQQVLKEAGHDNYYVGTVEAAPTLEDVLAGVKDSGAHKVVLQPLMIVAGDHANNDMALATRTVPGSGPSRTRAMMGVRSDGAGRAGGHPAAVRGPRPGAMDTIGELKTDCGRDRTGAALRGGPARLLRRKGAVR